MRRATIWGPAQMSPPGPPPRPLCPLLLSLLLPHFSLRPATFGVQVARLTFVGQSQTPEVAQMLLNTVPAPQDCCTPLPLAQFQNLVQPLQDAAGGRGGTGAVVAAGWPASHADCEAKRGQPGRAGGWQAAPRSGDGRIDADAGEVG